MSQKVPGPDQVSSGDEDPETQPPGPSLLGFFSDDPDALQAILAAIVDSSEDAIVGKTLDGTIVTWNAGAERIFGYTQEEAVGRSITLIIPQERLSEEDVILTSIRRGERIAHFETERVTKDGRRLQISLSVSPIKNAKGEIIGAAKIARDVTVRHLLQRERDSLLDREQAARAEAERANRAKDDFLALVSHELRTPLTPILSWSAILRAKPGDRDALEKGLEAIERAARAQSQIVGDLLDISRIIAGKIRLDVRPVDLSAVIAGAITTVKPAADVKGIRIQSILDPRCDLICGDADRLQQVVWNLLANAVKFTPKGGRVEVLLKCVDSHVQLIVADTGRGIRPEFMPYVFDRFRQAEPSATRVFGGLGLGLAIVRQLVELHGGTVHCESAGEGRGATFIVRLPLAIAKVESDPASAHPRAPSAVGHPTHGSNLSHLKVLVVDDDADTLEVLRIILTECGAEVETASSAKEALEALKAQQPDLVISDVGMPHQDGYELMQQIRGMAPEEGGRVPAIALTAFARVEDRLRAFRAGFQMHMSKPIEPAELIAVAASVTGRIRDP
jgi:PAS domain S-box-containing protein